MSLLSNVQASSLDWENRLNHAGQGEPMTIVLRMRGAGNALIDGKEIEAFGYRNETYRGRFLPENIEYELRVSEQLLTAEDLKGVIAIRHGSKQFYVIKPSPYPPASDLRFWRFWISTAEDLA
jgi:hypothetical protein